MKLNLTHLLEHVDFLVTALLPCMLILFLLPELQKSYGHVNRSRLAYGGLGSIAGSIACSCSTLAPAPPYRWQNPRHQHLSQRNHHSCHLHRSYHRQDRWEHPCHVHLLHGWQCLAEQQGQQVNQGVSEPASSVGGDPTFRVIIICGFVAHFSKKTMCLSANRLGSTLTHGFF